MSADQTSHDDATLLRLFANSEDEGAFNALVRKYTPLVFGVAMRRTAQRQLAEEITQNVFLALAKKAGSFASQRSLGAWLHRATTLESLRRLRKETTRQRYHAMIPENQEPPQADSEEFWQATRPLLDALLDRLSQAEREILVQHYFEGLKFPEIARRTGTNTATVQKRSVRALKKLARSLGKRGVAVPSAVLATGLGAELAHAVPSGLVSKIGSGVLNTAATTSTSVATGTLSAVISSKITFAAALLLGVSIPVGTRLANSQSASQNSIDYSSRETLRPPGANSKRVAFDPGRFRDSVKRLIEKNQNHEVLARRLQRLLLSLDDGELREAIGVLDETEHERTYDLVRIAFARWAEIDPESAIAEAATDTEGRPRGVALEGAWHTWAFVDWDAALTWIRGFAQDSGGGLNDALEDHLARLARIDGEQAVARAIELDDEHPDPGSELQGAALSAWARHDPGAAFAWMEQNLTGHENRDNLVLVAIHEIGELYPKQALEGLKLVADQEMVKFTRSNILYHWTLLRRHAIEAADYFENSRAGNMWDPKNMRAAGQYLARHAPARAIEIARAIEDPVRRNLFYHGILAHTPEDDPTIVLEAAEALSNKLPPETNAVGSFVFVWVQHDRAAATDWVEGLPEGEARDSARRHIPNYSR